MEYAILQGCPRLEIYNSRFTHNFGEWALGYCGDVYGKDNPSSLHQSDHCLHSVTSVDLSNRFICNLANKVCMFLFIFPFPAVIYSLVS